MRVSGFVGAFALCLAASLAGCGGADAPEAALPQPSAARLANAACTDAAISSGETAQVQGLCVRSSPAMGRPAPLPAMATVAPLTPNQLMDWAETQFPGLFPTAGRTAGTLAPYVYRYYPQSGFYLGVSVLSADVAIYLLYPNGQLARIGALADYTCTVLPGNCVPPGAPTLNSVVAGDTVARLLFTAPATSGGSAVTRYDAACVSPSASTATGTGTGSPITVGNLVNGTAYACSVTATNSFGTGTPSLALSVTPSASNTGTVTGTVSTAGTYCGYTSSVFNASTSVNATSTISISCDATLRTITANGLPDHEVGTFPNEANGQAIAAQSVVKAMPIAPGAEPGFTSVIVAGYAINGVRFEPGTSGTCAVVGTQAVCTLENGDGNWHIEALGQASFDFGLDANNARVDAAGAYHYKAMPEGLIARIGKGAAMTLVGFASDGFPVYARFGFSDAQNAASGVKTMESGWQLKKAPGAGRPSSITYPMGTFRQDYEFTGSADGLDECNGRWGVTPEFPTGIYHYYITQGWPYIQRCVRGQATRS